jgi:LysM repeat protein
VPSSTPIGKDAATFQISEAGIVAPDGAAGSPLAAPPTPAGARTYTVKAGDTCSAIAAQFDIPVADLMRNNRTIDEGCTNLHDGDQLRIPGAQAAATSTPAGGAAPAETARAGNNQTYTVVSGDNCDSIARSLGIDAEKLIQANSLDAACQELRPGQVLRVP